MLASYHKPLRRLFRKEAMTDPSLIQARVRLSLRRADAELPGAFGQGVALLLEGVDELHSLNKAAKRLGMAYSKAWRIVREAEAQLGCELLLRDGARGSTVTPEGEQVLLAYRTLEHEVNDLLTQRLPELLG